MPDLVRLGRLKHAVVIIVLISRLTSLGSGLLTGCYPFATTQPWLNSIWRLVPPELASGQANAPCGVASGRVSMGDQSMTRGSTTTPDPMSMAEETLGRVGRQRETHAAQLPIRSYRYVRIVGTRQAALISPRALTGPRRRALGVTSGPALIS
jgi:hypothetical protein